MTDRLTVRSTLFFFVKFLVLAPLCLVVWWYILPRYAWCLGQVSGIVLRLAFRKPVEAVAVIPGGLLNTETVLMFTIGGRRMPMMVGGLATNIAPYAALVLATPGLGVKRRAKVFLAGGAILALCHVAFIAMAVVVAQRGLSAPEVPSAIAQMFITMPFLLWVVFAFWDNIKAFVARDSSEEDSSAP